MEHSYNAILIQEKKKVFLYVLIQNILLSERQSRTAYMYTRTHMHIIFIYIKNQVNTYAWNIQNVEFTENLQ